MAPSGDRMTVLPEAMARTGQELHEPAALVRETFARLREDRSALGTPWGGGDEISDSLNQNLSPMIAMLDEFGEALAVAFERTADTVTRSATAFQNAENDALDTVRDLHRNPNGAGRR